MRLESALGWRTLLLAIAATMAVWAASGSAAASKICVEIDDHSGEFCPVPDLDPPPPPHCPLNPPSGYVCVPGPVAAYAYEGADPSDPATSAATHCEVFLDGATPADPNGSQRVEFRARARCNQALQAASVNTRLENATGGTVATGSGVSCHTEASCGVWTLVSTGAVNGLPRNAHTLVATVRFVMREPGAIDPWMVTPGTSPGDSPNSCTPGRVDVRCELRLPIPPPAF